MSDNLDRTTEQDPAEDHLRRVSSRGSGIGNEIAFYIFDYPPEDELRVREHIRFLLGPHPQAEAWPAGQARQPVRLRAGLPQEPQPARQSRSRCSRKRETTPSRKPSKVLLHEDKLAPIFAQAANPDQHDLVLVSGVGSVWPLLRSHTLLNNLHSSHGKTPLVMFYPGRYDGQSLAALRQAQETQQLLPGLPAGSIG